MSYDIEKHDKLIELRAAGATYDRCAAELEVSRRTVVEWAKQHADEIADMRIVRRELVQEQTYVLWEKRAERFGEFFENATTRGRKIDWDALSDKDVIATILKFGEALRREERPTEFAPPEQKNTTSTDTMSADTTSTDTTSTDATSTDTMSTEPPCDDDERWYGLGWDELLGEIGRASRTIDRLDEREKTAPGCVMQFVREGVLSQKLADALVGEKLAALKAQLWRPGKTNKPDNNDDDNPNTQNTETHQHPAPNAQQEQQQGDNSAEIVQNQKNTQNPTAHTTRHRGYRGRGKKRRK